MTDYTALAAQYGGKPVDQPAVDYSALARKYGEVQPTPPLPEAATKPEFSLFGDQVTTPPTEFGFNLPAAVIAAGRTLSDVQQGMREAKLKATGTAYQLLSGLPGVGSFFANQAQQNAEQTAQQDAQMTDEARRYAQLQRVHPGSTFLGETAPLLPLNGPSMAVAAGASYGTPLERLLRAGTVLLANEGTRRLGQKATQDYQASVENAANLTSQNAERNATLTAAQKQGFVVPPTTTNPTIANATLEKFGGKSDVAQGASNINAANADAVARAATGLPKNAPITTGAMRDIRQKAFNEGYAPIRKAGQFQVSPEFGAALDAITAKASNASESFPGAASPDVAAMVDSFRPPNGVFDASHAIDATQILRDQARALYIKGDNPAMADARIAVSKEIENELERQLAGSGQAGADMLQKFRSARQTMAIAHDVEDAIRQGSGSIEARVLARKIQNGQMPESSPLAVAAKFANVFPQANQPVARLGSQGVSKLDAFWSALSAGGGMYALGPYGAAAGMVPLVVPPAARALALSPLYQRFMTRATPKVAGRYGSLMLDNPIAPYAAGLLSYEAANR